MLAVRCLNQRNRKFCLFIVKSLLREIGFLIRINFYYTSNTYVPFLCRKFKTLETSAYPCYPPLASTGLPVTLAIGWM